MPFTPLHVAFVWPVLGKLRRNRFAAVLGALVPDFEIPVLWLAGLQVPRLLAHSLLGALTLDPLIGVIVARIVQNSASLNTLLDIKERKSSVANAWFAASIGALTHIAVDYLHHPYNPILWPILPNYLESPLVTLMGLEPAMAAAHLTALTILVCIAFRASKRMGKRLTEVVFSPRLLYRIFVELG